LVAKRRDKDCKIISNREICSGYYELKIKSPLLAGQCVPGQFFMLTVPGVFLRRPLSVYDAKNGIISFLYKVVGKGTKILSEMKSGEIKILGPLGSGYPLTPLSKLQTPNSVIVAGGTGIASVHFLASKLRRKGTLFYGAKTKKDLLCLDKFKKIGWKIIVSTEDGSKGHKGFITKQFEEWSVKSGVNGNNGDAGMRRCADAKQRQNSRGGTGWLKEGKEGMPFSVNSTIHSSNSTLLYVCGPTPMIKAVLEIAKENNINGYVSLEEKMACGIGNCQGCAVKINGVNKMTCKDGPVFKIEEIDLI